MAFGRCLSDAVEGTVRAYERLFDAMHGLAPADLDALGQDVGRLLAVAAPDALAEIRGIAAGAGVSADRLVAINARTEIFGGAGVPECSVIAVGAGRSGEGALLAQNWDWHPDAADSLVVWTVETPGGRWFTTLTEAGILAKIGLSSDGLGVCINILASSDDGSGFAGIPIHVMLRLLLERCATRDEAEALIGSTEYSASTAITVADAQGADTVEVSPSCVQVVPQSGSLLTHTNHFLAPLGDAVDVALRDWPDTTARLACVRELETTEGPIGADRVKAALRSHAAPPLSVCCHDAANPSYAERQQTLASVVMHLDDRRMEVSQGPPCVAPYVEIPPPDRRRAGPGDG